MLLVFAVALLAVLLGGANVYDRLTARDSESYDSRTCVQYLTTKVRQSENAGACAARNRGVDMARGEYIGFIDSDDWVEPDMYEKLYRTAAEHDADMVFCRSFFVFQSNLGKEMT